MSESATWKVRGPKVLASSHPVTSTISRCGIGRHRQSMPPRPSKEAVMSRSLSPREIAEAGFTHRVAGRARMACARLSNVTGADDIGHQLSQTYASLPEWARDRLQRIGKSLVS